MIVGADDGDRAERAVEVLSKLGYGNLHVLPGGINEWRASNLPVTGDNRDGVSYVSLLTPAKRAKPKKKK